MEQQETTVKTVLKVTTDAATSTYQVSADQGSSVNEMAFAVMVVIRSLVKTENIKTPEEFLDLVKKYLTDVQYQEVQRAD